MKELHRLPTVEDLAKKTSFPSLTAYKERFGSWSAVIRMWGNTALNKKTCIMCGKAIAFKKQSKQFCSANCARKHKLKQLKPKQCVICNIEYFAHETPNFKKRKICMDKQCKQLFTLSEQFKKDKKITPAKRKKLLALKGNTCAKCNFKEGLQFYSVNGKNIEKSIGTFIKQRNFGYQLFCPNHAFIINKKK